MIIMKRYYLAYGSNLYTPQMRYRCPSARLMGTAVIENYKLMFKKSKTGSYLTVEPKQGAEVLKPSGANISTLNIIRTKKYLH